MLYRCLLALLCLNAALLPAQTAPELLRAARADMGRDTNTALLKINQALEMAAAGSATADSAHYALQAYYKAAPDHLHAYPEVSRAYAKLETYYQTRQDTSQLTHLYLQWADLEQEVDLGESEKRVSQAIALAKASGDLKSLADSHFRMGVLQGSMRNDELVLQHFEEALKLAQAIPDTARIVEAHTRFAEFYQRRGQFDKVAEEIELALAGAAQAKKTTLINAYRLRAYVQAAQGDFAGAEREMDRSMGIARALKDEVRLSMLQLDMAQLNAMFTQDFEAAIDWLKQGAQTAEESGSYRFQRSAESGLAQVYEALGQPEEALQHYKAFYRLDTMIANRSDRQQLMRFEAKFQNEQQALEIARQKARQRFLVVLLASLLLLVLIVIAAYVTQRKARAKLAHQKAIIEQQANELKELDIAKSRLFANISHELRTPLTLMLGPASSLAKRLPPDSAEQSFLSMIKANGEQLLRRVNEILDLSKLDAGQLEVAEEAVHLPAVLRRQIDLFESYAYQQDIALEYEDRLPAGLSLASDEDKLCKIVGNLLSNAIKFTPPDGSVQLLAERRAGKLAIEVSDSGRGIPPEDLTHVFERFYQSKNTQAPLEGGTGIGLAFCKELANTLGGDIDAQSTLGTGSTFTLLLPYREMQAPAAAEVSTPAAQPGAAEGSQPITLQQSPSEENRQPGRILVVEDNIELQRYIAHVLAPYHKVQRTANGQEALKWLQDNGPDAVDLILSDVMMPEMDGFTLLEKVKADEQLKRLPVIMLTALAQQESRLKALRIGVDDYLLKPFQEEELLARVDSLLSNYRIRTAVSKEELDDSNAIEEQKLPKETKEVVAPEAKQDADRAWLQQLEEKTLSQISNTNFTMDDLAEEMHMSRRQFYRAVKSHTGLTPNQYTLEVRFQKARQLLEQKRFSNVKRVAYEVGFKDTRYFSQQYKKRFGRLPSGYL